MELSGVKSRLSAQMNELGNEQFEQLSKMVVEEVENPPQIELTPFNSDGGIDIRGTIGNSFFNARFAIQVKHYSNNVGSPDMRDFVGALRQHGYQFGCFITSNGYSGGAREIADDQDIMLIDGDRLADIMIVNEVGVKFDDSGYFIDQEFWSLFDETEEDERIESDEIPQADSFEIIHKTLFAINEGHRFNPEIKEYLEENSDKDSWTRRQADYYPSAAYILGFVYKDRQDEYEGNEMRRWGLTREGQEYIQLLKQGPRNDQEEYLNEQIRNADIIDRILSELKESGSLMHGDIGDIIERESTLSTSTSDRRRATIGNWLERLPEVSKSRDGGSYRYDHIQNLNSYTS